MKRFQRKVAAAVFTAMLMAAAPQPSMAQTQVNFNNSTSGNDDYADAANWGGFIPSAAFDEFAVIGSSTNDINEPQAVATANVDSPISVNPGGVELGEAGGDIGTLNINSGGSLTIDASALLNGGMIVGQAGTGILNVNPGGTLNAVSIATGGASASEINLIGSAGSPATLNTGDATLNRSTSITGPDVAFNISGDLRLRSPGVFNPIITGVTHSTVSVTGAATLGGALEADFSAFTPAASDTWELIDASLITGAFADVTSIGLSAPLSSHVRVVDGGAHGKVAELFLEERLELLVSRDSGNVSVVASGNGAAIDGYTIASDAASLAAGGWASLQSQGLSDWRESPAGGSNNRVSELKPSDSTTVSSVATVDLGSLYSPAAPTEFGDISGDDLVFEYSTPDGRRVDGTVRYVGIAGINSLTLVVDPDSGQAQLVNTSSFTVGLDGYSISSTSGTLDPTNWLSLDAQNEPGWRESNPRAERLSELKSEGVTTLVPNDVLELGTLYAGGEQDLEFVFQTFSEGVDGDFDDNGSVDGADFLVLQRGQGDQFGAEDLQAWEGNFGETGGAGAAGATLYNGVVVYQSINAAVPALRQVPEPASVVLSALVAIVLTCRRRL